jgi:hypothetical protein
MKPAPIPKTKSKVKWMNPPVPSTIEKKQGLKGLQKATDLIATEKAWCQHHYALGRANAIVPPTSKEAKCWCAYGALMNALEDNDGAWTAAYDWMLKALKEVQKEVDEPSLMIYNDTCSHTEVVALFKRAQEIAKDELKGAQA